MRKGRRSAERPGKAGHLSRVARPVLNMAELGRRGGPSREFLETNSAFTGSLGNMLLYSVGLQTHLHGKRKQACSWLNTWGTGT